MIGTHSKEPKSMESSIERTATQFAMLQAWTWFRVIKNIKASYDVKVFLFSIDQ